MSWYRLAQGNNFLLSKTIAQWLVQAYRGPVDIRLVQQDIDNLMPTIDDANTIGEALSSGESMARLQLKQQGMLTQNQQDVLTSIQSRFTSMQGTLGDNNAQAEQPLDSNMPAIENGQ